MTIIGPHPESAVCDDVFVARCAEMGVAVVNVDSEGRIDARRRPLGAGLVRLVVDSQLFAAALAERAGRWGSDPVDRFEELWPGCWVLGLPLRRRRRAVGYRVAVLLTEPVLRSEQVTRLVEAARMDLPTALRAFDEEGLASDAAARDLGRMLAWMAGDVERAARFDDELGALSQQLAEAYEELSLVYRLSARMTVTQEASEFLEDALNELQQGTALGWMACRLNESDERLRKLRGRLLVAGEPPIDAGQIAALAGRLINGLGSEPHPQIVTDMARLPVEAPAGIDGPLLIVPVVHDELTLGVIVGGDKLGPDGLSSVDSKLVHSIAQTVGIFVENHMLYDDVQDMFMGTLRSLVNAIDAKDTYTCGHSERVAWLGRELARAAGVDEATAERLHLAGLLHDVGKIGVPESVLTKPGRLTREEFEIIKTHPRIGARILHGIRQMQDLIPGVLYHHERYDGRGYPEGLEGHDIPLFGRVLGLADSFDAMSSDRTYRRAMPRDRVLAEIVDCSGSQFDPQLAEVFTRIDFARYDRMVLDHQRRQSLLDQELGVTL